MYIKRKTFSEKKKKRIKLSDPMIVEDTPENTPLSVFLGRGRADELDRRGKSESEVIKGAAKYGAIGGAEVLLVH